MRRFAVLCGLALMTSSACMLAACGPPTSDDDDESPQVDTGMGPDTDQTHPSDTAGSDTGVAPDTGTPADTADGGGGPGDTGPGTDGSQDAGDDGGMSPTAKEVDPQCLDGKYSEPLPKPSANISSIKSNYSSSNLKSFIDKVLDKRYPVGAWIVKKGVNKGQRIDCVERFVRDTSSASSVIGELSTAVHECGHIFDRNMSGFGSSYYAFTKSTTMKCSGGGARSNGNTFARSRITNDKYSSQHPPCGGTSGRNCDSYADIYLDGDPDDSQFQSGDQGFNMLLEEAVQYVNSLATDYAFKDHIGARRSVSALDGILTFLWYTERYLRMARLQYPSAYKTLKNDSCWRRAILTMWGRAWLMLGASKKIDKLGLAEKKLLRLVRTPELLKEIERIRTAHGCP